MIPGYRQVQISRHDAPALVNLATLTQGHPSDRVALVDRLGSCTYGELGQDAAAWRQHLLRHGIEPGDRVALVAGSSRRFIAAYLGVLGIGAVAVPLNPMSPQPELNRELDAISPSLFLGAEGVEEVPPIADGDPPPILGRTGSDPAVLLFTSGTAGFPKAAILTHGSLHANLLQVQSHPGRQATPDDVGLCVLPLFHVFGLNVVVNLSLMVGGVLVLADDPVGGPDLIEQHGVTLVAGVPVIFDMWARSGASREALRSVRMAISGAAPMPSATATAFEEAFGLPLWEGYGLTEASPVVTSPVFEGSPVRGSVGVPIPGVEVRLVEAGGDDALVGDPGEVWVRGPNVFAGYWEDEAATQRALDAEGWLHTGDVAVADEAGRLFLVERAKDLIIVSGFNVYPQEVERVICGVGGVAQAAVAGIPSSQGEAVAAFVVREPGSSVGAAEVTGACKSELAAYKCPRDVFFVDSLPRGASGEVLRRELVVH